MSVGGYQGRVGGIGRVSGTDEVGWLHRLSQDHPHGGVPDIVQIVGVGRISCELIGFCHSV